MTRRMALGATLSAILTAVAGVRLGLRPSRAGEATRVEAPDFSLPDIDGAPHTLSDLRGNIVLLNFWATYCAGCKIEMPWFVDFHRRYAADGLRVLAVAVDDTRETLLPYLTAHPLPFPVVLGDVPVTHAYNVSALPLSFLVDRQGRIAASHRGLVDRDEWEGRIRGLLRETA